MRLPLQPKLRFSRQSAGSPYQYKRVSGIYNGMVEIGDQPFTVNRPIFETIVDASAQSAGSKGRGVFYWHLAAEYYMANDTAVLYSTSMTACSGATLTTGSSRVYFGEVGNYLVIIDPAGNKGYYIDIASPTVVVEITDTDFPPKQTPALQLANGCAVLKGRVYVMDINGTIWNCDLEDPTSWQAGDNITAETSPDRGSYIARYNNEILAFGETSLEFFYYAANPTNSPLSVRTDIYHEIGTMAYTTFSISQGQAYFVGVDRSGGRGVYRMIGYQLEKISDASLDAYLTNYDVGDKQQLAYIDSRTNVFGVSFVLNGRTFYVLTFYSTQSYCDSYVYDSLTGFWYEWQYDEGSANGFPLVDWCSSSRNLQYGRGMLQNGDLISMSGDIGDVGTNDPVAFTILTGNQNFGTTRRKRMSNVTLEAFVTHAETEQTSQTAQLRFYDEGEIDSTGLPTHDLELLDRHVSSAGASNMLARAGSFYQRNIEITIPTDSNVTRTEIYALHFNLR